MPLPAFRGMATVKVLRTPEERFENLPGFPYEPRYRECRGMRLAHLDEGESHTAPTIMLYGEPTWSYLWGKGIEPLLVAGHRCVGPDLLGIRRPDKPQEEAWYSYDNTAAITSLFEDLDLWDVTLVVHDWGDAIGLRVVTTENVPSA